MKDTLVTFKTAKLAKEKKFDLPCYQAYSVWRENIRKTETEEQALVEIDIVYEPDYRGGSYAEIQEYYQSKKYTLAPSQTSLQHWLRNKHNINVWCVPKFKERIEKKDWNVVEYYLGAISHDKGSINFTEPDFKSYEEALENVLFHALKLIQYDLN